MASGAKDIQFRELKDTISQLSITIRTQNDLITSLQKMLEDRNAKDCLLYTSQFPSASF